MEQLLNRRTPDSDVTDRISVVQEVGYDDRSRMIFTIESSCNPPSQDPFEESFYVSVNRALTQDRSQEKLSSHSLETEAELFNAIKEFASGRTVSAGIDENFQKQRDSFGDFTYERCAKVLLKVK
jgi:hypothetical protein